MYAKIFFTIFIILIIYYLLYTYIFINDELPRLYEKINYIIDTQHNLLRNIDHNKINKSIRISDDSECYINDKLVSDYDKSIICYQSKNNKSEEKNDIAFPISSFVDAFLKKCLSNEDDNVCYPEENHTDTNIIDHRTDSVLDKSESNDRVIKLEKSNSLSESDKSKSNDRVIKLEKSDSTSLSKSDKSESNDRLVKSEKNESTSIDKLHITDDIIREIINDNKGRKKNIKKIIELNEKIKKDDILNNI